MAALSHRTMRALSLENGNDSATRASRGQRRNHGRTSRATPFLLVPPSAGSSAPTPQQIENIIDAPRSLVEALDEFKKKRKDAAAELVSTLARDLGAAPLNVEKAIARHRTWRTGDELLASKIETAEQLRPIVEGLLEELKGSHPDAFKAALHGKLDQLVKEATAEQEEVVLLKQQIEYLRAFLQRIEKPVAAAKGRAKKRSTRDAVEER
jgi:hypothetical protein